MNRFCVQKRVNNCILVTTMSYICVLTNTLYSGTLIAIPAMFGTWKIDWISEVAGSQGPPPPLIQPYNDVPELAGLGKVFQHKHV